MAKSVLLGYFALFRGVQGVLYSKELGRYCSTVALVEDVKMVRLVRRISSLCKCSRIDDCLHTDDAKLKVALAILMVKAEWCFFPQVKI